MNLDEMNARLTTVRALISDIASRSLEDVTDDELKRGGELRAEAEKLEGAIALAESAKAEEARAAEARKAETPKPQAAVEDRAARVEVGKNRIEDDPSRGYATARAFMQDVITHKNTGQMSEALRSLHVRAVGSDEQSTFSDPHGGFAVPETLAPNLLSVAPEADPIGSRVRSIPMDSPTVKLNARVDKNHTSSVSGGLTVARRSESGATTSSRMTMEQITLNASSLSGLAYATDELLMDSPTSFAAIIADGFRDEFMSKMIDETLNGTGAGQPVGINNSGALISAARGTSNQINLADVHAMRARVYGYQNAVWLANHDTYGELATIADAGSNSVYQPSVVADRPDLLLGRPIFYTEYTASLGTAGDLICADFSQYLYGLYQPIQSASSIHVRFSEHEQAFRFSLRSDGKPWWTSALTPKNSSTTLSPFVRLAA